MKKAIVMIAMTALIVTVSTGAYAHYEGRGKGMYGSQSEMYGPRGNTMYGPRGGMMHGHQEEMYAPAQRQGRGPGSKWNTTPETCDCGRHDSWNTARPGWKAQNRPGRAVQLITEDKAKETAETFVAKYLTGYTVDKIEKDNWRPLYFVTVKGENAVEMQLLIHGFSGQVMHLFPKTVEKPVE